MLTGRSLMGFERNRDAKRCFADNRLNVSSLSLVPLGNDGPIVPLEDLRFMKNEKLQSTTVRFTDTDLYLIERLQEKLRLGMIHITHHSACD